MAAIYIQNALLLSVVIAESERSYNMQYSDKKQLVDVFGEDQNWYGMKAIEQRQTLIYCYNECALWGLKLP